MKEILITSSVLIIVLLILRTVFATKVRRTLIYGTWLLVALRLLLPFQIGELSISVLNLFQPVTQSITGISDKQVAGVTEQDAYRQVMQDYIEQDKTAFLPEVQEQIQTALDEQMPKEEISTMLDKTLPEEEIYVPEVRPQVQEKVEKTADPITFGQILWVVWGLGAVAVAIWLAASNLRFVRGMKKTATVISVESPIPVYVTEKAVSPCLVGLFRPAVYLTPEVAKDEQLRNYVMTHELTHYAHKDHIWSMVRCLCLCLYWFNPLVWVAAWCSRRDCELACDEGAMARLGEEQRISYGKALLAVVQEASVPSRLMLTATTMAETKGQLRRRVHFIARKPHLSLFAAIALVLVCILVVGCVATGAKPQPATEGPNMEVPAITEPTESASSAETTAPTETVTPTGTAAPTDSTVVPEIVVPTETSVATAPTTEPTTPSVTTSVRPSMNIVPIRPTKSPATARPTNSINPPATTDPAKPGATVTPTKTTTPSAAVSTTNPTTAPTAIPTTAPTSAPIVYRQGPFSQANVSGFMTLLRAKYPHTTGVYTREEHCYNNTPAEVAAETTMQFFTFALTEKSLIMTENEVFDLGIASFSPSMCERLINALPYDFDGDGVKDLLIAQCRETGGSYDNRISVFNPVSKELANLYIEDNGTHDYALYVTPTNAAGQITHKVSRVKMRYTYEKDSDNNPIPTLKEYTVNDTAGYIAVVDGKPQFVTSPSSIPPATTVPTTVPTAKPTTVPTVNSGDISYTQPSNYYGPTLAVTAQPTTQPTTAPEPSFISDGIKYLLNGDGVTCTVVGCEDDVTDAVIPKTVNGYTVTAIGDKAFYNGRLHSITCDAELTSIGEKAFYGSYLSSITCNANLGTIGNEAFKLCGSLKTVNLPDSVTQIGDQAFRSCYNLQEIRLPQKLTTIGNYAFAATGLQKIIIPEGVTTIMDSAFYHCDQLVEIQFPDSLQYLGGGALTSCTTLQEVRIPSGITALRTGLFYYCSKLEQVYLPSTVTKIEMSVFLECPVMKTIYYDGTVAQWNAIDKEHGWSFKSITVQCTDGQLTDLSRPQ